MPTVLQINIGTKGSTGTIAESINRMAMVNGWQTYFAYGRSFRKCESNLIHIGNKLSQAVALLEARLFDKDGLSSRWATHRLVRQIKQIKPDIVHIHNLHGYYINYKILFQYLNSTNIPVIWTLHDCWSFTGHCAHFVGANCMKWKTQCYNCPAKSSYPKSILLDSSKRHFDLKKDLFISNNNLHLVAVSKWLADFAIQSFFKNTDIQVIHNGVDLNVFHPMSKEQSERFCILGVSSVWTKSKGLFDFYELRKRLDRNKYEIVLIGLSDKQITKLPDGITGITRTNSAIQLAHYYSKADVYVNPTYGDSFPTTNLEALACGTPVVTYRTGGCPEAIDKSTGIVVKQGDIGELVNAINACCQLGKDIFRSVCRERAERLFDKNARYLDYIRLYDRLMKNE